MRVIPSSTAPRMARSPASSSLAPYQPAKAMAPSATAPTRSSPWPSLRVSIILPPGSVPPTRAPPARPGIRDGELVPPPGHRSDDPARAVESVRALAERLAPRADAIAWTAPAHSAAIAGDAPLAAF